VGCRVWGVGCRMQGVGCRVQGVGCRLWGKALRISGFSLWYRKCKGYRSKVQALRVQGRGSKVGV
jgi:hypothetical protein